MQSKCKYLLWMVILIAGSAGETYAQQPGNPDKIKDSVIVIRQQKLDSVSITFPLRQAVIDSSYMDNAWSLRRMRNTIAKIVNSNGYKIDSILLRVTNSPEGEYAFNAQLATNRADSLSAYIDRFLPKMIHNKIKIRTTDEDWSGLRGMVAADNQLPYQREALDIIDSSTDVIQRDRLLQKLDGGRTFSYMSQNFLPVLRRGTAIFAWSALRNDTVQVQIPAPVVITEPYIYEQVELAEFVPEPLMQRRALFALKTNLLFDLMLAPNIGIEVPIGQRWSIAGEWIFPWWLCKNKQYCMEILSGNIEGRYWFGNRDNRAQLTGWFAGIYAGCGLYDLEWDKRGYQGEFYIAAGLSGGYAHKICRNLSLEYSLGIGYLRTKYTEYKAEKCVDQAWRLIRQKSGTYTWVGPTQVRISLVWMLNYNSRKKGGLR